MLELTLSTDFTPSTNRRGDVAGANWCFLLPRMDLQRVLCIGTVDARTLSRLVMLAREVVIICRDDRSLRRAVSQHAPSDDASLKIAKYDLQHARQLSHSKTDKPFDLILMAQRDGQRWFGRDVKFQDWVLNKLNTNGCVYVETRGWFGATVSQDVVRVLQVKIGIGQKLWLTPISGEMQTAVPSHEPTIVRYFMENSLCCAPLNLALARKAERFLRPSAKTTIIEHLERFIHKKLLSNQLVRRYGYLLNPDNCSSMQPPEYLRLIARKSGIDIHDHKWGLHAAGAYGSRKILFFLFRDSEEHPEYVVKLVRDSSLNSRLDNEARSLDLLEKMNVFDAERLPFVKFSGHHAGLSIVGESAICGKPFREKTIAKAECPFAKSAIDWLIELGAKTTGFVNPLEAADALQILFERFLERYQMSGEHVAFLQEQVEIIRNQQDDMPVVFQHGDPGIWNVLVNRNGEAVFLDWEAGEPKGVPLWDLFYFLRSFGVTIGRRCGAKTSMSAFEQQFMKPSSFRTMALNHVIRCSKECQVPNRLISPLFFTCWMHRALKESTRLSSQRMERGHYVNLLRFCIDKRSELTVLGDQSDRNISRRSKIPVGNAV